MTTPNPKFCISCGAQLIEAAKFCAQCGTAVAASPAPAASRKSPAAAAQKKAPASRTPVPAVDTSERRLNNNQLGWLAGMAIAALIATSIYYYIGFVATLEGKQPQQPVAAAATDNHDHEHAPVDEVTPPDPALLREAEAALAKEPNSEFWNTQMGNLLFDSQQYDKALPFYQKSISLNPNNPDVIVDLGVCFFNLKEYPKATDHFDQALKINADHVNALYNMGVVAVQVGDIDRLIHFWSRLREVAPESPQAQRAGQILEQIHQQVQETPTG